MNIGAVGESHTLLKRINKYLPLF